MRLMKRLIAGLAALLALIGAAVQADPVTPAAPLAPHAMVAAANPLAANAGLKVLRSGGSAMDAAVAVQMVLALVEPQSSSLGGGAFMVYFDGKTHKLTAYDGREVAPAGATPALFLKDDGTPLGFGAAIVSGHSAGVPGAIAMLYLAHKQHGTQPWGSLFADAEKLAKAVEEQVPGVEDVTTDVAVATPQVNVTMDRDKAASMNVNASLIENALYDAYGPRWVSTIYG